MILLVSRHTERNTNADHRNARFTLRPPRSDLTAASRLALRPSVAFGLPYIFPVPAKLSAIQAAHSSLGPYTYAISQD